MQCSLPDAAGGPTTNTTLRRALFYMFILRHLDAAAGRATHKTLRRALFYMSILRHLDAAAGRATHKTLRRALFYMSILRHLDAAAGRATHKTRPLGVWTLTSVSLTRCVGTIATVSTSSAPTSVSVTTDMCGMTTYAQVRNCINNKVRIDKETKQNNVNCLCARS